MHSIMANLYLGQDVANKRELNRKLLIQWPNLIPYSELQECVVTVLLLTLTPLDQTINVVRHFAVNERNLNCHRISYFYFSMQASKVNRRNMAYFVESTIQSTEKVKEYNNNKIEKEDIPRTVKIDYNFYQSCFPVEKVTYLRTTCVYSHSRCRGLYQLLTRET